MLSYCKSQQSPGACYHLTPSAGASALGVAMRPDAASEDGIRASALLGCHAAEDQHLSYRDSSEGVLLCRMGSELTWGRTAAMGAPSPHQASTRSSCSRWRSCRCPCPTPMRMRAHAVTALTLRGMRPASASSTSDESDTCLDDSSLAGYCPCQMNATHKGLHSKHVACCKTCSTWTSA